MGLALDKRTLIGDMRNSVLKLVQQHHAEGTIPTNARFLYYELVSGSFPPPKGSPWTNGYQKTDKRLNGYVIGALTMLRKSGDVDWEDIEDETREIHNWTGEAELKQGLLDALEQVRLDPWEDEAPLVITESRSLVGALRRTCSKYRVQLASLNGQCGGFLHTDLIPILNEGSRVLYFGDWDLRGGMIEDNARSVLEEECGELNWERLALTTELVKKHKLPIIEKLDRSYKPPQSFDAVETEALSQSLLVKILEARLKKLLPEPLAALLEEEAKQREALRELIEQFEPEED
jgi:hypothetical protein